MWSLRTGLGHITHSHLFAMIIDCHTHIWGSEEQLGGAAGLCRTPTRSAIESATYHAGPEDHLAAADPVDKTIVLAIKSYYLQADVPNEYVAGYVRQYSDQMVGFAAVDPAHPREAIDELHRAHDELGMKGVTTWPAAQDCHPASTGAMRVYAETARLGMPMVFHQDVHAVTVSKMEFARPYLLDEVAREFSDLRIVVSQLGYPWVDETIALLSKHKNVFA
ncbi:MAG: amidohydrolase family protein, partial [Planctomycetota bacterium]